jgi:hypothetical protein
LLVPHTVEASKTTADQSSASPADRRQEDAYADYDEAQTRNKKAPSNAGAHQGILRVRVVGEEHGQM